MTTMTTDHEVHVEYVGGNYCWKPVCTCGAHMWGYTAKHAAEWVGEDHVKGLPGPG